MHEWKTEYRSQLCYEEVATICDRCKKRIPVTDTFEHQEVSAFRFVGGYGSVWGDGAELECELCQQCVKEIFAPFVRVPQDDDANK